MMETPIRHPDVERVREHCAELRLTLRELVETSHRMTTVDRPRLTSLYDAAFGDIEGERQALAIRAAELARRVELLSVKVARGETLTPETIDLVNKVVDKEFARFRQRLREAFEMTDEQREAAAREKVRTAEDDDLVNMYRTLAKNLHPDAVGDSEEKRAAWHTVQEAYQNRDTNRLRTLLTVLGADEIDEASTSLWDLERWHQEERHLEAKVRMEKRKLDRLKAEEPFCIAAELEDQRWIKRHRQELETELAQRTKEIAEHMEHYGELTNGRVPPGTSVTDSKEEQDFQQDFMTNTYFSGRS